MRGGLKKTRVVALLLGLALSYGVHAAAPVEEMGTDYQSSTDQSQAAGAPVSEVPVENLPVASAAAPSYALASPRVASPAVPFNQRVDDSPSTDLAGRLARLEKQVGNIAAMNFSQQLSYLQQQIAQLRGQLAVQGHDLALLNTQVRSFYSDLDARINQIKNLSAGEAVKNQSVRPTALLAPVALKLRDNASYQAAFTLLVNHQYPKAIQSFKQYLSDYPNGHYVADATYWLGELFAMTRQVPQAMQAFERVIQQYPTSSKVADAKLKIAMMHLAAGKVDQAKRELAQLKKQHPDSSAAQLASIHLQEMSEEK